MSTNPATPESATSLVTSIRANLPLVEVDAIDKRFPGVQALSSVTLALRAGEIVGLAGENGSGKSTLMKILAGRYSPDAGTIRLRGAEVRWSSAAAALRAGVALTAQEVAVHPEMCVTENLLGPRMPRRLGVVRWQAAHRQAREILDDLGLDIAPGARLGALALNTQHMVAIGKMISRRPDVLILDEPTASLTETQVARVFGLVRALRDDGTLVVLITHRLREYFELCDRVAVLRDGHLVGERAIEALDEAQLVSLMVGRELSSVFERIRRDTPGPAEGGDPATTDQVPILRGPVLRVRGLTSTKLRDVDLDVGRGEVVGVAGQAGAGRSTLARALFGLVPHRGSIQIDGEEVRLRSARQAIAAGVGFVPEDRKGQGLVLGATVHDNVTMTTWAATARLGISDSARERVVARDAIDRLSIRVPSPRTLTDALSGGNQQKVVIGKWLATKPKLLLLDEPTRGVDVGAKAELYQLIDSLAAAGVGVLVFSSELLELLRLSDRIVVMAAGRVVGEIDGDEATEESITRMAFAGLDDRTVSA